MTEARCAGGGPLSGSSVRLLASLSERLHEPTTGPALERYTACMAPTDCTAAHTRGRWWRRGALHGPHRERRERQQGYEQAGGRHHAGGQLLPV